MALIKIVTLLAALWAGVLLNLIEAGHVSLSADAGPSLLLLVTSVALARRWLRSLAPDQDAYVRSTFWDS